MKKCLIMLAVLMTALIISIIAEHEDIETTENIIAAADSENEYLSLKE